MKTGFPTEEETSVPIIARYGGLTLPKLSNTIAFKLQKPPNKKVTAQNYSK